MKTGSGVTISGIVTTGVSLQLYVGNVGLQSQNQVLKHQVLESLTLINTTQIDGRRNIIFNDLDVTNVAFLIFEVILITVDRFKIL